MKIIDNEEKKSVFSKKKAIILVCTGLVLLVVGVGAFVFIGAGKDNTVNSVPENGEEPADSVSVENVDTVEPSVEGNGMALQGVSVKDKGKDDQSEELGVTTGIYTKPEDLANIIIDTMKGMNERFENYAEKCEAFKAVLDELNEKHFVSADQLNERTGLSIEECEGLKNLKWLDVCGSIGLAVFNEMEDPYMHPANYKAGQGYLSHAIAYRVYRFELKEDELEIEEKTDYSIEISGQQFDVNFEAHFEHEGIQYTVLIGNVNGSYVVLDVFNAEDLKVSNEETAPEVAEQSEPQEEQKEETPLATPEDTPTDDVSNPGDGRDNNTNPGLVTEPNGDVHPQIGHRYDDNNPSLPVYEGPKEGYTWGNSAGYLPVYTGPVGQTGNDMGGDQSPCEYDENGNCTVHQHSGY